LKARILVEFRLLYTGQLLASGNKKPRPEEKHALRREFHPQLRRLWNSNHNLNQLARNQELSSYVSKHPEISQHLLGDPEQRRRAGIESISYKWERAGFKFVPLVTEKLSLRCRLEILFLRPEERHYVMQSGDLDGRLKTVFDALRIPKNSEETGNLGPQNDETPFFCLLEDDNLISEVSITTDQLLVLPKEREVKANDAFLIIHVQINHRNPGTYDQYFG
jgi:hypothetical protein